MDFDKSARLFGHFASPVRLRILSTLLRGESTVTGLVGPCEVSLSGVSQHMTRLSQYGFVKGRRDAQCIFYSLSDPDLVRRMLAAAEN